MVETARELLTDQLTHRFGVLPADAASRLHWANLDELYAWADRVLDAPTLADVWEA